jgi:hypothetical protein
MFIVGMLSWWYGAGWRQRVHVAQNSIEGVYDYFSIDLLLRTLFSPFRQISAGSVRGPIGVQMRAWFDQLISRTIGSIVRSLMIIIGSITLFLTSIIQGVMIAAWALIPVVPFVGIILGLVGWMPWQK